MALDQRQVSRAVDDGRRSIDRLKEELRQILNNFDRLGQDFRNDRRFQSDASGLKDELRQVGRDVDRLKERIENIGRSNR